MSWRSFFTVCSLASAFAFFDNQILARLYSLCELRPGSVVNAAAESVSEVSIA